MSRVLSAVIGVLLLVGLAACSGGTATEQAKTFTLRGEVVINNTAYPSGIADLGSPGGVLGEGNQLDEMYGDHPADQDVSVGAHAGASPV